MGEPLSRGWGENEGTRQWVRGTQGMRCCTGQWGPEGTKEVAIRESSQNSCVRLEAEALGPTLARKSSGQPLGREWEEAYDLERKLKIL